MTKFAIGCLVQWYEIQIIKEYISSVKAAVNNYAQENVILDFTFIEGQNLEKFDGTEDEFNHLVNTFHLELGLLINQGYSVRSNVKYDSTYSIANYRRDFNEKYCDFGIWGMRLKVKRRFSLVLFHRKDQRIRFRDRFDWEC